MPLSAFIFLLANYIVCSFLAGVITTLVAQRVTFIPALAVGIALTLGGLYNVISIRHPLWFSILNLVHLFAICLFWLPGHKKKRNRFRDNNSVMDNFVLAFTYDHYCITYDNIDYLPLYGIRFYV